jgi:hypothetical protein
MFLKIQEGVLLRLAPVVDGRAEPPYVVDVQPLVQNSPLVAC